MTPQKLFTVLRIFTQTQVFKISINQVSTKPLVLTSIPLHVFFYYKTVNLNNINFTPLPVRIKSDEKHHSMTGRV